jgi:hypothetical protein
MLLMLPVLFLLAISLGCDNESNSNAVTQPAQMLGADVTGKVNIPPEQTYSTLISGISASDTIVVEIESTGNMTGDATITNSTAGTTVMCSGMREDTFRLRKLSSAIYVVLQFRVFGYKDK